MLMTVYLLRQEINIKEITMNLFEEYKKVPYNKSVN